MNFKKNITLFFTTLFSLHSFSDSSLILTSTNVQEAIELFDESIPEKNIKSINQYLDDKIKITLEFNTEQGVQIIRLNKAQYIDLTLDAWSKIEPSVPDRKIIDIQINTKRNKALVKCITTEIVKLEGKTVTNRTQELLTFGARNGVVKLQESYSKIGINEVN